MSRPKGGAYNKGREHAWSQPRGINAPHRGVMPIEPLRTCLPPPCRTLADMTAAEIAAIEARYGAKVIPRAKL